MKKTVKLTMSVILFGMLSLTLSSFTGEDESGAACDLCKVEGYKKTWLGWLGPQTVFSCKLAAAQNCYKDVTYHDKDGIAHTVSVSCANATACP